MARRQAKLQIGPPVLGVFAAQSSSKANGETLSFNVVPASVGFAPPFAHIGGMLLALAQRERRSHAPPPPLARMASPGGGGGRGAPQDDPKFQRWLEAMAAEEMAGDGAAAAAAPRKHTNEWYADRCAFCAACRAAVDAEPGRRGGRCAGCRRWFHAQCRPARGGGGGGAEGGGGGGGGERYFHSDDCRLVFDALRAVAAQGRRPLPAPPAGGGGLGALLGGVFWQRPADAAEGEPLTVRLLDFADVKDKPAARGGGSSSGSGSGSDAEGGGGRGAPRSAAGAGGGGGAAAVDDFLLAAELLTRQYPGDGPKDILEDSFGVLLQRGGAPLCVATLNLYAPDHARIQSLVSAEGARRRGNAALLVGALHDMLADAGLARVVAVISEDTDEARAARDRLLTRRLGYRPVPIEEVVAWRAEIPEYHKSLVGGFALLQRPLVAGARDNRQ
ncbi:MAG: hypothetical protein J3K34DRAFT_515690 [Monoraphidium minutum]|nr:MAG: hypothetical protein J3K34DRAFT_515690 [Monoraphidium minutum]